MTNIEVQEAMQDYGDRLEVVAEDQDGFRYPVVHVETTNLRGEVRVTLMLGAREV